MSSTTASSPALSPTAAHHRLHALDAYRSSMMLLGILLHISWFFMPNYAGHPITDQAASWFDVHFVYWIHTYRMQAFFVVAGFFGAMLLHKRGAWGFIRNRLVRIGLTLVLFQLALYPIMQWQYQIGGRISGRVQSDLSPWRTVMGDFQAAPWSQVSVLHLWFLLTLLLLYGISLTLWIVFSHVLDRRGVFRQAAQRVFTSIIQAPCGEVAFAVPVAALVFAAGTWLGIDSGYTLKPIWKGVFAYWVFFAVGWCVYQRRELLASLARGWWAKLLVGTAMSVALCMYYNHREANSGSHLLYPLLVDTDIRDYGQLRAALVDPERRAAEPFVGAVWDSLAPPYQRFMTQTSRPTSDQLAGMAMEISLKVIADQANTEKAERRESPGRIVACAGRGGQNRRHASSPPRSPSFEP